MTAEAQVRSCPICKTDLRLTDSVTTPEKAPNSNIGMVRAAETTATARPEPVTSRVNKAAASKLEESHRVDAAADRPQAQERGRRQQGAQAGGVADGAVMG